MADVLLISRPLGRTAAAQETLGLRRQLGLLPLVMIFYFTVSGGAYGLEPVVSASGPGMALLLIAVTPLIWSVPAVLMVAELSAAIPVEGGYYAWVKKGLGSFWGFQEGWWSWLSSFVDMAIYPVLFASYLSALLSTQFGVRALDDPLAQWLVGLVVIWGFAYLNVRGVRLVGHSSILFGVLVLAPFTALVLAGIQRFLQAPAPFWQPVVPPETSLLGAFGAGLFVVMWNYQGWDSVSPVNGEVEHPRRTAPLAMWLALPLVILAYLLPVAAGLLSGIDWAEWKEGAFPQIGAALGGQWLGTWLAIGGLFSAAALFNANLLSVSRLPFVMAADGYLPDAITRLHPRFGTPWISILLCAAIYSLCSWSAFTTLVVIDVVLYAASLLLEFAALIALRITEPQMVRPYRVPGGWPGVMLVALLPAALLVGAVAGTVTEEGTQALSLSSAALASGVVAYPLCRLLFKRGRPDLPVPVERTGESGAGVSWWRTGRVAELAPRAPDPVEVGAKVPERGDAGAEHGGGVGG
jgi:amino acid transporter